MRVQRVLFASERRHRGRRVRRARPRVRAEDRPQRRQHPLRRRIALRRRRARTDCARRRRRLRRRASVHRARQRALVHSIERHERLQVLRRVRLRAHRGAVFIRLDHLRVSSSRVRVSQGRRQSPSQRRRRR